MYMYDVCTRTEVAIAMRMERGISSVVAKPVKASHLRDVLQLRVVGLREHEAEELDGGVQVRLVSVSVAGHVALDGFEGLAVFCFQRGHRERPETTNNHSNNSSDEDKVGGVSFM